MNALDYVVLAVLAISGFLGFRAGLFKKILGLVSFVVGLIFATKLMSPMGRVFHQSFGLPLEGSYVLAFLLILVGIVVVQGILAKRIGELSAGTVILNRAGGTVLGLFQGILIASVILVTLSIFDLPSDATRRNSLLYKSTLNVGPRLFDLCTGALPESKSFYEELKRDLIKYKVHPA